jgi:GTPase SAR1 family protein
VLNPTQKKNLTVLLLGATGSGKTSFMSLLVNLFQGCGPFELAPKHDLTKESGGKMTETQTKEATLYTITTSDGTKIQILDTPGFADTQGIKQDEKHKAEINNAIKKWVTSIDAVIIVTNGDKERSKPATDYTLKVLTSMFPHSIIDNIGFVFTHSNAFTFKFRMEKLPDELKKSRYWLIDNPLLMNDKYQMLKAQGAAANVLKSGRRQTEDVYEEAVETLNDWLKWLDDRTTQPTTEIDHLYQMTVNIEANIEAAISVLTCSTEQRKTWEDIQFKLQNATQVGLSVSVFVATANQPPLGNEE